MISKKLKNNFLFVDLYVLFIILFSFFLVELYFSHNAYNFSLTIIVLNLLIYFSVFCLFYIVSNNTKFSSVSFLSFFAVFSMANHYVYRFRGNPLLAADLFSLKTAADVAGGYDYTPDKITIVITSVFLLLIILTLILPLNKHLFKRKSLIQLVVCSIPIVFFVYFFFFSEYISSTGINTHTVFYKNVYESYGSATSFVLSAKEIKLVPPEGYSTNQLVNQLSNYESDKPYNSNVNIIAIVDESFSDLGSLGHLETNVDYMPFLHSLNNNTIKGELIPSIWGGNTCNSEFEFLTGNSMGFLPINSVAFNKINRKIPSLCYTLKADGYDTVAAYHPAPASNWNRSEVYPYLGFDSFIDEKGFSKNDTIRNFLSDEALFDFLIKEFNEQKSLTDSPIFLYTMTMQNHGGYIQPWDNLPNQILVTDNNSNDKELAQYINLIKKSDEAIEKLITYFANHTDEKVVIVYFGDHQPRMSDSVYNNISPKDTNYKKYIVPFYIWANYDIEEKENVTMSINYLSSYLLSITNNGMTGYNKFLLSLNNEIPTLSSVGYTDIYGSRYELNDSSSPYYELINTYNNLQYCNMFDMQKELESFFFIK